MIYTIYNVLFPHRLYGLLHELPVIILDNAGEFLGPQHAESSFDFWEHRLDRVVIRRVGNIIDIAEA